MIETEIISANALRMMAPEKLKADDFRQLAPQVDSLISQHGKIRLLIDASGFNGCENIAAFQNHAGFIKTHQQKVERVAVIAAHNWQHWLIGAVGIFLYPEVSTIRATKARPCNGSSDKVPPRLGSILWDSGGRKALDRYGAANGDFVRV